jgi:hypothetical protein
MKYIDNSMELTRQLKRLMTAYEKYYLMVAWAGAPFELTRALIDNEENITKLVVGLHFYQTHPDFIDLFNGHAQCRFIKNTSGTFHPKVYLFANDENNWEAIVGSANFTNAAYSINSEACLLISSTDCSYSTVQTFNGIKNSVETAWQQGRTFTEDELIDYKKYWQAQQQKINSLGRYNREDNSELLHFQIPIIQTTWKQYIDRVSKTNATEISERIAVLDLANQYFTEYPSFSAMPRTERSRIGGYVWASHPADFRLFGNMLNATDFTHAINNNPEQISFALDAIPKEGIITREQYVTFADRYETALQGGNKYRSASRLLAMKRPDTFFCISSANQERLAEEFGIRSITQMNLIRYWDEIIERITEANWWLDPTPQNETEKKIAAYRSAFIDTLYYIP